MVTENGMVEEKRGKERREEREERKREEKRGKERRREEKRGKEEKREKKRGKEKEAYATCRVGFFSMSMDRVWIAQKNHLLTRK